MHFRINSHQPEDIVIEDVIIEKFNQNFKVSSSYNSKEYLCKINDFYCFYGINDLHFNIASVAYFKRICRSFDDCKYVGDGKYKSKSASFTLHPVTSNNINKTILKFPYKQALYRDFGIDSNIKRSIHYIGVCEDRKFLCELRENTFNNIEIIRDKIYPDGYKKVMQVALSIIDQNELSSVVQNSSLVPKKRKM